MIRHLRAMIWLRWRLMANALHGGRRRDKLEQISRALAVAVPLAIAAVSVGSVLAIGVLGFVGGRAMATGRVDPAVVVLIVRGALLAVLILVLILSVTAPTQSALTRYARLLLLPIPRRVLHLVEVLANLADPWVAFAGVGLFAFAAGLLAGGQPGASLAAIAIACLMLVLFAALGALVSFLVGWLLRSRRRGEMFTIVFVLVISFVGLIPAFLAENLGDPSREERRKARREGQTRQPFSAEQIDRALPAWMRVLPSEIGGRALGQAVAGNAAGVGTGLAVLGLQAGLMFAGSSVAHRRLLDSLEGGRGKRRSAAVHATGARFPLIGAAASAVAWAQARTALRSVRGRVAVLMPGPMMALVSLLVRGQSDSKWMAEAAAHGYLVATAGLVFSLYAIQAFTMNLFASDRAGLTLQFLSPLGDRDLAWGKVAGCGLVFGVAAVVSLAASLALNPTGSPMYWIAIVIGGAATYLLLAPFAVWMSALFPVASDLTKTGGGGNPHALPMFVGTFLVLLLGVPPGLIVAAAMFWFERPLAAPLLMLAWLGAAVMIAVPGVRFAARMIGARRENLALTAQGK